MRKTDRRDFFKTSAMATAAIVASPYLIPEKVFADSPNDRFVIGSIGLGNMGTGDAHDHHNFGNIVAVCDVDENHVLRAKNDANIGEGKADTYKDYRKVLERNDIEVVSIATPDHWHIKIAVEALMAGKHVFCQKPLTLTLEENQIIRKACQKFNKVFQVGTQQRDSKGLFLRAVRLVRKGLLGDIKNIVVGINGSPTGGPFPIAEVPKNLDWDFWLGQAPTVPYRVNRCHDNFRWWYEYSGGKFTDWGAHHIDIAQWALGVDQFGTGPIEIDGTNTKHPVPYEDGYPTIDDCYNTSNYFDVVCKFANGVTMHVDSFSDNGILFEGTKGRMFVSRGKIAGKPIDENWDKNLTEEDITDLYKGKPHEWHKANFYRCIREGGLPVSDVFSHVQAMNTCHLCSLASRFKRVVKWDPKEEKIVGDEQVQKLVSRTPRKGFEIASF